MGIEQKCWKWKLINQRTVQTKENTIGNIEKKMINRKFDKFNLKQYVESFLSHLIVQC